MNATTVDAADGSVRAKIFRFGARRIINAVYGLATMTHCSCLPAGYRAIQIANSPWVNGPSIDVLIEHESFDPVMPGQEFPMNDCRCNWTHLNDVPTVVIVDGPDAVVELRPEDVRYS